MVIFKRIIIKALYLISPLVPDKIYLKILFPLRTGYRLNLKNPITYNEKLQWLKLYNRDPALPDRVDKYEYKVWAENIIGSEYVPKTYGLWTSAEEIDFNSLPDRFVIKTTHDQGGVLICKEKSEFDEKYARKMLKSHLRRNLYNMMKEWPYKEVKPRIMAEELLSGFDGDDLFDYKFYCFDGEPRYMYVSRGRQSAHTPFYFFDMNFNPLSIVRPGHEPDDFSIEKPQNWELMIKLARKLSYGQPHVRIDFYNLNGKVKVGEYTLFQGGGMMPFIPEYWDYELGKWLNLPLR